MIVASRGAFYESALSLAALSVPGAASGLPGSNVYRARITLS